MSFDEELKKKEREKDTAEIRQGFLGVPSRVIYKPGSEQNSADLAERLKDIIKKAGGILKFLID